MAQLSRRTLLVGGTAAVALATTGAGFPRLSDPFTLGVASGDPTYDGVLLWTRPAPKPVEADGLGGMPRRVRADFRALPDVSKPVETKASFAIEDHNPGLHRVP